jgi:hypothetical protein
MGQKIILTLGIVLCSFGLSFSQEKELSNKVIGQWINTSLFDSTLLQKKLSPWISEFYGTAVLQIDSKDSILIYGCMDGSKIKLNVLGEYGFTTEDVTYLPKFEYLENSDLIKMTTLNNLWTVIFRRVKSSDRLDIIEDEKKFEAYFINQFFHKFLIKDKTLKIDELWIGFLTHTPFDFDAIGVKTKKDTEYFGWELNKNTLRLYKTKRKVEADSGFYFWEKGNLYREIKLK